MAIQIQCVSVWMSLRKLFLTAQAVNLRFPLQVPIFEKESIPDKLTSRYFAIRYTFAVRGFCALFSAFKVLCWQVQELWKKWPLTQFHDCTFDWPVCTLQWQILHLSAPPPNRLYVISQILGDTWPDPTRVYRRVGERTWERGCHDWFLDNFT